VFCGLGLFSQDYFKAIQDGAVEIESLVSLNSEVYETIRFADVIMMGEMHGTNEPSEFVEGIARIIIAKEDSVSVGIEIPENKMLNFLANRSDSSLATSKFFTQENLDGRNGMAWLSLVSNLSKIEGLHLFFFDNKLTAKRDSSMYLGVLEQRKQFPNEKIVTLTGNLHNWTVPFNGSKKLGAYLIEDETNFGREKVVSINHMYRKGTMLNNTGNGLELTEVNNGDNMFNQAVEFQNYLCPIVIESQDQYDFYLYTNQVTHSEELKKK